MIDIRKLREIAGEKNVITDRVRMQDCLGGKQAYKINGKCQPEPWLIP